MNTKQFTSVWDAIEDTPEAAENMKLRSSLMLVIIQYIRGAKLSQLQASKLFGVTQPRISDLVRGKIDLFGLDALVNMATAAGIHIEMHCYLPRPHSKSSQKRLRDANTHATV